MKRLMLVCLLLFPTQAIAENVTVTAYYYRPTATMASGEKIKKEHYGKVIALSSDLAKGKKFGEEFQLKINNIIYHVTYLDRMPNWHKRKIDFLLPSNQECKRFGVKKGELTWNTK
jgi:hypothetical protein